MNCDFESVISFWTSVAERLAWLWSSSYLIWTGCLTLLTTIPPRWLIQSSQRSYPCLVRPPSLDCAPVRETAAPKTRVDPLVGELPVLLVPQAASSSARPTMQGPSFSPRIFLL